MKITEILEQNAQGGYSLEFFPPKTQKGVENLKARVERLHSEEYLLERGVNRLSLFIDLTWGAGGSSSDQTLDLAADWTAEGRVVNMHVTTANMSRERLNSVVATARKKGIENLVLLRGDPPKEEGAALKEFACARDLVEHIDREFDGDHFCVSVAGYPEGHQSQFEPVEVDQMSKLSESEGGRLSRDRENGEYWVCRDSRYRADLEYLKSKVEAGGDLIITQLFFDVRVFLQFERDCREIGITCPILPGIMLFQSVGGFKRMVGMCKTRVPISLWEQIESLSESEVMDFGIELGKRMVRELHAGGVRFFHLYTLNKEKVALEVAAEVCRLLDQSN